MSSGRIENADDRPREGGFMAMDRRQVLSAGLALAVSSYLASGKTALADEPKFAVSLGWTTYESGQHFLAGFKDAVATLGGTVTVSDANADPKKQSDQIDALVAAKPSALFIIPYDAVAIAPAVKRANDAGVPVFIGDSIVPGAIVQSQVVWRDFDMGAYMAEYIAEKLGGKGDIAAVVLPDNQFWNARTIGLESVLAKYPDLKLVATYPFSATTSVTPRQAVDSLLTGNPGIKAVWCAWDGAAVEGALAVKAAGRDDVILTGIGGGKQPFEYIKSGTGFKLCLSVAYYELSYSLVYFAHQFLAGKKAPPIILPPVYAVTQEVLADRPIEPDYDRPEIAAKLGWKRVL